MVDKLHDKRLQNVVVVKTPKGTLQRLQGVFHEAYTSQGLATEPAWSNDEEIPGSSHLNDSGET
jgi:hypothetical protein